MANDEVVEAALSAWSFVGDVPPAEAMLHLLTTLPATWGVQAADFAHYVLPLTQQQKFKRGGTEGYEPVTKLYMQVSGRVAMLQRAQELHHWWVTEDIEYVNQEPVVCRVSITIGELPTDSDVVILGTRHGTSKAKGGDNAWEKMETAARGRAIAAWGFGVLPGSGIACVPRRAEALTREGWKPPEKLTVGEDVLVYDMTTDRTVWSPLEAIHEYAEQPVYRVGHSRWSMLATASHRWAVRRKPWPGGAPGRAIRTTVELSHGEPHLITARPVVADVSAVDARDAALLGWLATDGSIAWTGGSYRGRRDGPYPTARIQQSKYVQEVRRLVGDFGSERLTSPARIQIIKGRQYACRDGFVWSLHAAWRNRVFGLLDIYGKADLVRVPAALGQIERRAMYEAMMAANGSTTRATHDFATGHPAVMDTFQALAALLGLPLGPVRRQGRCLHVSVRATEPVIKTVVLEGREDVWCPQTAYGTWVCRLDGQVSITGNSVEEMQDLGSEGREPRRQRQPKQSRAELEQAFLLAREELRLARHETEEQALDRLVRFGKSKLGIELVAGDDGAVDLAKVKDGQLLTWTTTMREHLRQLRDEETPV